MKLRINPPSQGIHWVQQGIRTFWQQPLALSGLFLMFLFFVTGLNFIPYVGTFIALILVPAGTLGLMAATQKAQTQQFPMPTTLLSAFRVDTPTTRAILTLGVIYIAILLVIFIIGAQIDDGKFARWYLWGGAMTDEIMQAADFQISALVTAVLCIPLTMLFWHAPALVVWHRIAPAKSLFFSMVACWRNFGAFVVYGLAWLLIYLAVGITASTIGSLLGGAEAIATLLFPAALFIGSMFSTSLLFTVQDCLEAPGGDPSANADMRK